MADEIKTTETTGASGGAEKKTAPRSKVVKPKVQVPRGCAYIQATYNNTMISITDQNGNVLAWSSSGHMGFAGPKKATPYAATQIVREVADKVKPHGVRELMVFVKGVGSGRDSAVRALNASGFQVLVIKDVTPIPHNGPRAPKPRRV